MLMKLAILFHLGCLRIPSPMLTLCLLLAQTWTFVCIQIQFPFFFNVLLVSITQGIYVEVTQNNNIVWFLRTSIHDTFLWSSCFTLSGNLYTFIRRLAFNNFAELSKSLDEWCAKYAVVTSFLYKLLDHEEVDLWDSLFWSLWEIRYPGILYWSLESELVSFQQH